MGDIALHFQFVSVISNFIKQHKKAALLSLLCWLLICILATPVMTTVSVRYSSDPPGEAITTVFTALKGAPTIRGAKSRVIGALRDGSAEARITFLDLQYLNHNSLKRIDPFDEYWTSDEPVTINEISVKRNGLVNTVFSPESLGAYFEANSDIEVVDVNSDGFSFRVIGNDPQLNTTEAFVNAYVSGVSDRILLILSSFVFGGLLLIACASLLVWFHQSASKACQCNIGAGNTFSNRKSDYIADLATRYVFLGVILSAVGTTLYTARRSPFWLNPDEYDVKAAVNYYFTHFFPPDIRSDLINDSYPVYGTSRHFEWNTFYLWAGKIGNFFSDPAMQMRAFSIILFVVMAFLIIKYGQKYFALIPVLIVTPQIWYIFSYSTSDALDFFIGFLCLFELIKEDSTLNRILNEPFKKSQIPQYLIISYLYVHVIWSKASFYPILVFLFLILLIRLFEKQGKERGILFGKYMAIVGLFAFFFVSRYMITDFPRYGFDKLRVIMEVTEQHADYGYKPSTPPLEQAYSMSFMGKGITLKQFFTEYEFNKNLFRTMAGFFGCYTFGGSDLFYNTIGALYAALLGCILYGFARMKDIRRWLEFGAVCISVFVQYVLVVFNAWVIDFQPQGRYMLSSFLFVAYLFHICPWLQKNKLVRIILCLLGLLSVYAFAAFGIPNLVPHSTVSIR